MPSATCPSVPRRATQYRRAACLAIATCAAVTAVYTLPTAAAHAASTTIYATSYVAVCDGILLPSPSSNSVDGAAIQAAINVAEAQTGGATVVLPPGECVIAQALRLKSGDGIVLAGATTSNGIPLTTVTDPINPPYEGGDLSIGSDGNTIQDLIMDQSHYGSVVYDHANDTLFQDDTMLGGPVSFALFFVEQSDGLPAEGNQLVNSTVVSLINRLVLGGTEACDDGIVWANQNNSLIQNVTFTGTRLALYEDTNTTVDGYTYYPGPQTCGLDGFYITQPSSGIRMSNLTMYGSGGVVSNGGTTNGISTNITISNEHVLAPTPGYGLSLNGSSHGLQIRNVKGVTVSNSNFDSGQPSNSGIQFQPTAAADDVTIANSILPRVGFWGAAANGTAPAAPSQVALDHDTLAAYPWPSSTTATVLNTSDAPATVSITGGTFLNYQPANIPYYGLYHGSDTTFTITNLGGYPGPTSIGPSTSLPNQAGNPQPVSGRP